MPRDSDVRDFSVTPRDYNLTAAIIACRLNRNSLGGCIGFALERLTGVDGSRVTLLYDAGPATIAYPFMLGDNPEVKTIARCLG